jgi:hypothetical protein
MISLRADYNQGVRMSFRSKEDAIHFAERQGMSQLTCFFFSIINAMYFRLGLLCVSTK